MRSKFLAVTLIVLGTLFLLSNFNLIPRVDQLFRQWWPLLLIVAGVYMLSIRGRHLSNAIHNSRRTEI